MQRLILIRHGETDSNRDGRIQGFRDSRLSELGREQAERLRVRLDHERIDVVYSSPATRAVETGHIAVGHRFVIETREALREINLGVWEGAKVSELKRRLPSETDLWFRKPSRVRIEGAEPLRSFRQRVTRALSHIRRSHETESIIVFAHGGVICAYLTSLLGLKLDDLWRFKILNGSVSAVVFPNGDPRIELLNDTSHLSDAFGSKR
ncbi:MAG: histidine phosphatase family protein [Candidatus Latescibacterota bacterium]|nr:MAG: histidine phosphatase family protein [Candidatus Latescibacterota bacterium]